MQIASYFTYFFYKILQKNALDINLFNFYEKLLDLVLNIVTTHYSLYGVNCLY